MPHISTEDDARWMAAALALARRGRGRTGNNPNVGCILVQNGTVVGRGTTADGGRPHAEAMALAGAGARTAGATAYVTLEPCAHQSQRGDPCADALIRAGVARVVAAIEDPDPRTTGKGLARLRAAGITVDCGILAIEAARELAGFTGRLQQNRPELTLKLALSLDGRLAMADGRSQWITSAVALDHVHQLRAQSDLLLVGGGTLRADQPRLTMRLDGCTAPQPLRAILTSGTVPDGMLAFRHWQDLDAFACAQGLNRILCEGGGALAASLLAAGRVDRLVLLRAPILIGHGIGLEQLPLADLADAHGRWQLHDRRPLGPDLLEVYLPKG